MADGSIIIDTKVDRSGLESGLSSIKSGISSAAGVAVAGIAAATAALAAAGTAVVSLGTDYEHTMAKAATLYGDVSVDVDALNTKMLAMSSETGTSATALGDALYSALSAGIPVTEDMASATDYLNQSAKLAVAGFTDVDTATRATAKVLNAYKMGVDETDRVQKVLMATQNKGITTVGELSESLAQVTPTAAAMGVSFEQVGAALATMTAQGTPTAQATTQLNGLLAELGKSGTVASENLAKAAEGTKYAGLSFQDMEAAGVPLNEIIDLMGTYADKSGLSLLDMFSSIDAGKAALAVSGENAATFSSNLEYMSTSADLVGDAYDTMMDTLSGQTSKLKESTKNLGISIYNGMSGKLKDVAKLGNTYVTTLSTAFQKNGMTGLVGAFGSVIGDVVSKAADFAPQMIDMAVDLLDSLIDGIVDNADTIADGLADALDAAVKGLIRILPNMLTAGLKIAMKLINAIADSLPDLVPQIIDALVDGLVTLVSNIPQLLDIGVKIINGILSGIVSAIPNMIASIASLFVIPAPDTSKVSAATQTIIDECTSAQGAVGQIEADLDQNITDANTTYSVAQGWLSIIDQLKEKKTLTSDDWSEYELAVAALNTLYPDLNLTIDKNTGLIDLNTTAIRNQILAYKDSAMAQSYKNAIQKLTDELVDEQLKLATSTDNYKTKMDAQDLILAKFTLANKTYSETFADVIKQSQDLPAGDAEASIKLATQALQDNSAAILALIPSMEQYYTTAADGTAKLKPGVDALQVFGEAYDSLGGVVEETNAQLLQSYTDTDALSVSMTNEKQTLDDTQTSFNKNYASLQALASGTGTLTTALDANGVAMDSNSRKAQDNTKVFELAGVGITNSAKTIMAGVSTIKDGTDSIDGVTSATDEATAALQTNADKLTTTEQQIATAAANIQGTQDAATAAQTAIAAIIATVGTDTATLLTTMLTTAASIKETAQGMMDTIEATFTDSLAAVAKAGSDVAQAVVDDVTAILTDAAGKKIVTTFTGGIKTGFTNEKTTVTDAAKTVANATHDKFSDILSHAAGSTIGGNITDGIADGITDGKSGVVSAAVTVATAALTAAKNKLDINSPSGVFRDEVGGNISKGISAGILGSEESVTAAMDKLAMDMQSADLTASMRAAVLQQNQTVSGKSAEEQSTKSVSTANENTTSSEDSKIDYAALAKAIWDEAPESVKLVDPNGTYIGTLAEPTVSEIQSRKLNTRKKV